MSDLSATDIEELDALEEMTRTRGWRYFKNLLTEHRNYCIEKAHQHLADHQDRAAGEWLACSKEPHKILTIINNRRKELSDKREKE